MAYNVGQVEVSVFPNAEKFNAILGPELTARAGEIGRDMGDQIADRIRERLATIGDVNLGVDTTKAGLEVDKFLAETKAKGKAAGLNMGTEFGTDFSNAASKSGRGASPLIVGAVAGGLIAGAPVMLAAAGLLFGGIAAAAVHSNAQVKAQFDQTKTVITSTFSQMAQVTVPIFTESIRRIGDAVRVLAPQFHEAFFALTGPVNSLTSGIIMMASNAMPGLVSAVQAAGPVFKGIQSLLASIGTGLGQFFQIISQHAGASGTVFKALGDIISALLPILGQLVGAGAELGAQILPPLAAVLHVVAGALNLIAPVLPAVATGFLVFMGIRAITPLLATFAQSLAFASYSGGTFAATAGKVSTAVSGLSSSLPVLGAVLVGFMTIQQRVTDQSKQWAQALLDGGTAAATAKQQMSGLGPAMNATNTGFAGFISNLVGMGVPASNAARAIDGVKAANKDLERGMSPLELAQRRVTQATNDLDGVLNKSGHTQGQVAAAAGRLKTAQSNLAGEQRNLAVATEGAMTAAQRHQKVLQGISTAASAASTQVGLLKASLDSLTGAAVTADQAQLAVTQALIAAKTATQGQSGALLDASGHLNLFTAKGAAASQALIQISDNMHTNIATMEQHKATTDQVAAATATMRSQFIHAAEQMGINSAEAQRLADRYLGIPTQVNTRIHADTAPAISAIDGVLTALAQVRDKTITITTVTQGFHVSGGSGPGGTQVSGGAIGGIVHAFAGGGIEPMQGGIAQIMPPNRMRIIGDRITDDEAYIPINRDLRSQRIWAEAGQRMGLLSSGASRGPAASGGSFTGNLYLDSGEFLGKVRGIASAEADRAFSNAHDLIHYGA